MTEAILARIVLKTAVLLLLAFGVTALLSRASAALRHLIWAIALSVAALTPLLEISVPRVDPPSTISRYLAPAAAIPAARAIVPAPVSRGRSWPLLWIAGSTLLLGRLAVSRIAVARILRRTEPRDGYRVSRETSIPFLAGLANPVIVLPLESDGWDRETLESVLLHERAHARRRDGWTSLAGQAACAIHWFHPLAWLALRRMRAEQERACDDLVLGQGVSPSGYAQHLLDVAKRAGQRGFWRPAAVTMADSSLPERIQAILEVGRARNPVRAGHLIGAAVSIAAVGMSLAAMRPAAQPAVISGFVSDGVGAVPGAEVSVLSTVNNVIINVKTDDVGRFRTEVEPGGYEVYIRAAGFAVASSTGTVRAGETVALNTVLRLGDVVERIEVAARRETPGIGDPGPGGGRLGGNVRPARLLATVPPLYPEQARNAGIQGEVLVRGVIRKDGTVGSVQSVASPSPLLTEAAKVCVSQWRYEPARLNGVPVETVTNIKVQFELTEK